MAKKISSVKVVKGLRKLADLFEAGKYAAADKLVDAVIQALEDLLDAVTEAAENE